MRSSILLAVFLSVAIVLEDLAKRYPGGKISWSGNGLSWSCTAQDVWELKSFELSFRKDFSLECGKSTVAIGAHETNVLWAVVFPDEPARLVAKGQPGDGESTRAILLRFAPAEIGRVFPSKTVSGPGRGWKRTEAARIFRHKLGYDWFTPAGDPTVVPAGITLVDVDTVGGKRRFYVLDGGGGKLEYVAEFESKPVPPEPPIERKEAERAFDQVWKAFDAEYANFVLLPKLKWDKLGADHKKQLARVETRFDLAAVLSDMLANLEDLHVWVKAGEEWLSGYTRPRPQNASWRGSLAEAGGEEHDTEHDLVWSRTKDGIGYLNVHQLGDQELPRVFDETLEELADAWALVIDLRFNGGGDEPLAEALAGRFVDQERVYSKHRYRSGPGHDQLGETLERKLAPRGPWRYESPVIALWGQRTMSSAESFALMLAQCPQLTSMGDRTAGSSANPRSLELECGITVNLPRWHDMDPAGNPLERVGVQPEVKLDFASEEYGDTADPLLKAALARLRKLPSGERESGKR